MSYIYPLVCLSGSLLGSFGFIEKNYFLKYVSSLDLILHRNVTVSILMLILIIIIYLCNNKKILNNNKLNINYYYYLIIYSIVHIIILYNIFNGFKYKPAYKVNITIQLSSLVSATLLGYYIFNEKMSNYNIIGIILAFISLCLILC